MPTPAEVRMLKQIEELIAEHGGTTTLAHLPDESGGRGDVFAFGVRMFLAIAPVTAATKGVDFDSIRAARTTLLDLPAAERTLIADLAGLSDEQKARLRDTDGDQTYSIDEMTSMIFELAAIRKSGGGTPEHFMAAARVFKCFIEALPMAASEKKQPDAVGSSKKKSARTPGKKRTWRNR